MLLVIHTRWLSDDTCEEEVIDKKKKHTKKSHVNGGGISIHDQKVVDKKEIQKF